MAETMVPETGERRKPGRPAKFPITPGMPFERLTVVERVTGKRDKWLCTCRCGNQKEVFGYNLTRRLTRSCGCLQREIAGQRQPLVRHDERKARVEHGLSRTSEYRVWAGLLTRCENPNSTSYKYYGKKGITVSPEWHEFTAFLADVGPRPSPEHTIERRDGTLGYEQGNAYWALREMQMNNLSSNVLLTARGETLTVAQWARKTGLLRGTIRARLKRGLMGENALAPVA